MTSEDAEFTLGGGNTSGVTCVNEEGTLRSGGVFRAPLDCFHLCDVAWELVLGCLWTPSHCVRHVVGA